MENLWLIPGSNDEAFRNIPKTMSNPITKDRLVEAGVEDSEQEYYAWGTKAGNNEINVGKWRNMSPGDICLFYTQDLVSRGKAYHWLSKIVKTERSRTLSEAFWDDPIFELVYFIEKPTKIQIAVQDFSEALQKYRPNYMQRPPMGFMKVEREVAEQILLEHDSIANWVQSISEAGSHTEFVESFLELQNRIKEWSDAYIKGHPRSVDVASHTAHWYYSPIYDTFGPSKFIGYKNMISVNYNTRLTTIKISEIRN